jgi:hypothetical protein
MASRLSSAASSFARIHEAVRSTDDAVTTLDHSLGPVLLIGRKMTRPIPLSMIDLNGNQHECVAEAFDTTWNVVILLYPVRALTSTIVLWPACFQAIAGLVGPSWRVSLCRHSPMSPSLTFPPVAESRTLRRCHRTLTSPREGQIMRVRTPYELGVLIRDYRTRLKRDQTPPAEKVGVSRP